MPTLFWLALLLGYLAGLAAAVVLWPSLIRPVAGPLVLMTVIALAAFGVLFRLRRLRRRARQAAAVAPVPVLRRASRAKPAIPAEAPDEAVDDATPAAAVDDRTPEHPPEGRWPLLVRLEPPGVLGPRELQAVLAEDRVDVRLRPIASLERPDIALYHALPRLHMADDSHLAPARYRSTAARCGLLGLIDQRLLRRTAELLGDARAEGREVMVVCEIAADSLSNPAFGAELERQLDDDPQLGEHLVLGLDQAVRAQPGVAALAKLRARGMRFCLRRIGPPPADAGALGANGFEFVLLDAARFALSTPDGEIDPALLELQRGVGSAGPMLLIGRVGFHEEAIALPGDWALSADDGAFDLARSHAA